MQDSNPPAQEREEEERDSPWTLAAETDAAFKFKSEAEEKPGGNQNALFRSNNLFISAAKKILEEHRETCEVDNDSCYSCRCDTTCMEYWDEFHRGTSVLQRFGNGRTMKEIIDHLHWQTSEKITDPEDPGEGSSHHGTRKKNSGANAALAFLKAKPT